MLLPPFCLHSPPSNANLERYLSFKLHESNMLLRSSTLYHAAPSSMLLLYGCSNHTLRCLLYAVCSPYFPVYTVNIYRI
jgi:hypothetical protein